MAFGAGHAAGASVARSNAYELMFTTDEPRVIATIAHE